MIFENTMDQGAVVDVPMIIGDACALLVNSSKGEKLTASLIVYPHPRP
jgi:hypothetical protein